MKKILYLVSLLFISTTLKTYASDLANEVSIPVVCYNNTFLRIDMNVLFHNEDGSSFYMGANAHRDDHHAFKIEGDQLFLTDLDEKFIVAELPFESSEAEVCKNGSAEVRTLTIAHVKIRSGLTIQRYLKKADQCYSRVHKNYDYPIPIKQKIWYKDITIGVIFQDDTFKKTYESTSASPEWSKRACKRL
jgi:hypothetical protein